MKNIICGFLILLCIAVQGAENGKNVLETPAIDFRGKYFVVSWNMTPAQCKKDGFERNPREDDNEHFCMESGDMQYYFQRKGNRLTYCRIFGDKRQKSTARIVNRNVALLGKKDDDVTWNDLPRVRKGEDDLYCTYVIRYPDAVMLFITGNRGAYNGTEMRIFNPAFYSPTIKSISKKYVSMIED